ncbi:MAG TPA: MBL fold metallo-hydrolase, partial [Dehalococcoidia bacterium]|nr:MBL fold metallo-hydrolase [Dehalococcoidia bacterium]
MKRPGIHQITLPIPFPLKEVHVYLVEAGDGLVMIDAGFPSVEARDRLEQAVTHLIGGLGAISAIVVSHLHPDHSGLAGWLQERCEAPVYIHEKDHERLQSMQGMMEGDGPGPFSGGAFAALPQGSQPEWERMRKERVEFADSSWEPTLLQGGEQLTFEGRTLEMVWTPGHTEGHLCMYDREEDLLFTGDHLLSRITPHIGLWAPGDENPLIQFERSCALIEDLAPGYALPAHEADVEQPAERSVEIRDHHQVRRRQILETIEAGSRTGYEISRVVFAERTEPMQQYMALSETLAHVDAL